MSHSNGEEHCCSHRPSLANSTARRVDSWQPARPSRSPPPHGACLCLFRTARARSETSWGSTSWPWWCRVLHASMRVVFSVRRNWDAAYQLSEAQNPTFTVLIVDSVMHCTTIPSFALFFARVFFVEAPLFLTLSIISIKCLMSRKGALLHFQAYLLRV